MVWRRGGADGTKVKRVGSGWLHRLLLAGVCAIGVAVHEVAVAQNNREIGVESRPFTLKFSVDEVNRLILEKRGDFSDHRRELRKRSGRGIGEREIERLARGNDPLEQEFNLRQAAVEILDRVPNANDRYAFFRGAGAIQTIANQAADTVIILGGAFSCMRFRFLGVCVKLEFPKPRATVLARYSFPTVKIETVDQPHKTGYIPRELVNRPGGIRDLSEDLYYGGLFGADVFEPSLRVGVLRAQLGAGTLGGLMGVAPEEPFRNAAGGPDSGTAAVVARDMLFRPPIDRNMRGNTRQSRTAGFRHVEYHLMPEFVNQTLGSAPPWCHQIRTPFWFSDWPGSLLPARFSGLSMVLWPSTMIPMTLLPQVCTIKNKTPGQGKTPLDLAFPLAFPDPLGIIPGQDGCMAQNGGPWLPVTNTAQSVHFTDASRVGTMKAIQTANRLIPTMMYTYQPARGDQFQWTANDRMPRGCGPLEKWKLDENPLANSVRGKDSWNVSILWTRFTCCLKWRGETPTFTVPPNQSLRFF